MVRSALLLSALLLSWIALCPNAFALRRAGGRPVQIWDECELETEGMDMSLKPAKLQLFSPYALSNMMKSGEQITIVDVRSETVFRANHLAGARNVSYNDLMDVYLPPDRLLVLYCGGCCCPEVSWAASALMGRGYDYRKIGVLRGGLEEPGELVLWNAGGAMLDPDRLINLPCGSARDEVVELEEKIRLKQVPAIEFEYKKAVLRPYSKVTLKHVGDILIRHPDVVLKVFGHTCSLGTEAYNLNLSERRAEAVKAYLRRLGVEKTSVISKGFGESKPIASNETEEGRQANRRVEFLWVQPD